MISRQIDKKTTKQVRIDIGLHQELKVYAAASQMTIKEVLEDFIVDHLAYDKPSVYIPRRIKNSEAKKRNENLTQPVQKQNKKSDCKPCRNQTESVPKTDQINE